MVKQKRPQPSKPYDCIAELKAMPKEFWLGVPTYGEVPHHRTWFTKKTLEKGGGETYINQVDNHNNMVDHMKQKFSGRSWDLFIQNAHKLHPQWCKFEEQVFFGDWMQRHIPEHFATYTLNGIQFCSYNRSGNETAQGDQEELVIKGREWTTKERDYKVIGDADKKFASAWNRLRKEARRACGKEPDAQTAKARELAVKQKKCAAKHKEVLQTAEDTLACVQKYVNALKNGTANEADISDVYFSMIALAEQNKEWKEIAGVMLKR